MGTEPQVIDIGNGLAPPTLLVVTLTGISYVSPTMHEPTGIGLAGLSLLSKLNADAGSDTDTILASVEAELGTDRAWLEMLMKSFGGNGLIIPADAPASPPTAPLPQQPSVSVIAEFEPGRPYFLPTPLTFRATAGGFTTFDWQGDALATLTPIELVAAAELREPSLIDEAMARHQASQGKHALSPAEFDQLLTRLIAARLVRTYDHNAPADLVAMGIGRAFREVNDEQTVLRQSLRADIDRHEADEEARRRKSGVSRPRVVPVAHNGVVPPLALGLIFGYAKTYNGGVLDEHYDFYPSWMLEDDRLERIAQEPGIYLFSNYVWSFERCLAASARVKQINPNNITIHGGPSTPKYELDSREYFRRYPHVDITVRGEGEATTAEVLDRLRDQEGIATDLSVLRDVNGISFRDGDRVSHTPDRDRIKDLDEIPSPYLTGMFDAYVGPGLSVTLETNRGCPYGCTFCDWGSATLSRIRKFDLDRVLGEFEWCSRNGIDSIGLADANFGIWSRDVEIVQNMVELKHQYGSPKSFNTNLAKNTSKHTKRIIQMVIEAGITTQAYLAMQTMDASTLEAIDRSNISLEKYEELATEFRKAGLPLIVDIMVGLPGQTVESFRDDLQECTDREVDVSLADTELLVNSPMNAPDYREKYGIEASAPTIGATRSLVVSTTTFTRDERELMNVTGKRFDFLEYLGVLRHIARFVRQEIGLREVDFYDQIAVEAAADPNRWPALAFTLAHGPETPIAPASWRFFIDEVHDYLTGVLSLEDDSSLATALAVQHALLPDRMRIFPCTIELTHDYTAWHRRMIEVKDSGHRADWPARIPRLREFGPAPFTITKGTIEIPGWRLHFEMDSAVSRNRSATSIDVLELVNTSA